MILDKDREVNRQLECPCRRGNSCGMIDVALGWHNPVPIEQCDDCWSKGGPTTPEGYQVREEFQRRALNRLTDLTVLGQQAKRVVNAVLDKHMTPEEAATARQHPAIKEALARTPCSGCKRKRKA